MRNYLGVENEMVNPLFPILTGLAYKRCIELWKFYKDKGAKIIFIDDIDDISFFNEGDYRFKISVIKFKGKIYERFSEILSDSEKYKLLNLKTMREQ